MSGWKTIIMTAGLGLLGAGAVSGRAAPPPVDIRDPNGKVLIAADQIRSYEWKTHTLTLAPKVNARLSDQLLQSRGLAGGVPFTVTIDGKSIYSGNFTSVFSSKSFSTPIILVGPGHPEENLGPDQLRIQLGYPTQQFFKGADPRSDARLYRALRAVHQLRGEQLDAKP